MITDQNLNLSISKILTLIFFTFSSITFSSCSNLTKKLWEPKHYEEEFKHFLINQRYGFVAFLTQKYHYVFSDNSNLMKSILSWQDRRVLYIDADASELHVNKNNEVRGDIMIRSFNENLMPFREAQLFKYGFRKDKNGWFLKLKIFGTRYKSNPNVQGVLPQLDLSYKIKVYTDLNKGEVLKDVLLTPLTITADGIITIGKILLLPMRN